MSQLRRSEILSTLSVVERLVKGPYSDYYAIIDLSRLGKCPSHLVAKGSKRRIGLR